MIILQKKHGYYIYICGYTNGNKNKKLWLLHFYYNKTMVNFHKEFKMIYFNGLKYKLRNLILNLKFIF